MINDARGGGTSKISWQLRLSPDLSSRAQQFCTLTFIWILLVWFLVYCLSSTWNGKKDKEDGRRSPTFSCQLLIDFPGLTSENKNKEERYSRVPRLSDTRYSAKWRYASSKARLKCATYRRYTDLSVMGGQYISVTIFYLAWKLWASQVFAVCGR